MNTNWKTYWKALAKTSNNTAQHHFQYCLLKALGAKSNNKVEIAKALLRRAFTPVTNDIALHNGRKPFDTVELLARWQYHIWLHYRDKQTLLGQKIDVLLSIEEVSEYMELLKAVSKHNDIRNSEEDYMFIFVRQDITPVQQAVQAAHVSKKAGRAFTWSNVDETNFVLIGLPDEAALREAQDLVKSHDFRTVVFFEPDLGDTLTAIAVEPMKENQKRFLKKYKKLEF